MVDTRKLYDVPGIATTYHASRALPAETLRQWTDAIRAAVAGLDVHLAVDVGAGTGRFTSILGAAVRTRVVAIERSAGMIGARDRAAAHAATFVQGDAHALPLRTGSVDVLLLSMVYHQLADRAAGIAEMRRVLRDGGRALIQTPTRGTIGDFLWLRFFPEALAVDLERMPSEAELMADVARAGFRFRGHMVIAQRIAGDLAEYVERIRGRAFSSLQALPDDVWQRGLAEFEAHCCRSTADGPVDEPVNFFVFD